MIQITVMIATCCALYKKAGFFFILFTQIPGKYALVRMINKFYDYRPV